MKTTDNRRRSLTELFGPFMIFLLSFCPIHSATAQAAPAKPSKAASTLIGEKVKVDGARDQPCYADSCAHWGYLTLTLPAGSQYIATHYFTNADTPSDLQDVRETGPNEVAYAHFSTAKVAVNANNEPVISVIYYNRANRDRLVQLTADYQVP